MLAYHSYDIMKTRLAYTNTEASPPQQARAILLLLPLSLQSVVIRALVLFSNLLLTVVLQRFPCDGEHHGIDPVAHDARLQTSEKESIPPKEPVLGADLVKSF